MRNPRLGDTLHREAASRSDFGRPTSKISEDLPRVAEVVRQNALRELGIDPTREEPNLLKQYMERRLPFAGHRLLNCMAAFAGEGWETGARTQNLQLGGYDAARLMIFCEQAALDSGRLQLAWLLACYSEPTSSTSSAARRSPMSDCVR